MDHRISKDMISNGMTPSGQKSQQDLSRSQYGSAATPASLAEAYRKIHEMNKPPKPGVGRGVVGRSAGGNTMQSASSAPPKKAVSPATDSNFMSSSSTYTGDNLKRPASSAPMKNVQSPDVSATPKSDKPLATLNRAKKGDGFLGPTITIPFSGGKKRIGIPNISPIRNEEVEQVNEGEKPMGQHPGKSPDKATRDRYETQSRRATAPTGVGVPDKSVGYGQLKQSVDLFDIVKGHLMSEGLSEEDALKKMLEMTEEEKAEIVEMNAGPSTPVKSYDGKIMPNYGGGRIGKVRPKKGQV